jgi:hypothetical protein
VDNILDTLPMIKTQYVFSTEKPPPTCHPEDRVVGGSKDLN